MSRRDRNLKYRYGINSDIYDSIYDEQQGICPVCGLPLEREEGHIDHDHNTGEVRGILHPKCNMGIGKLDDDPNKIQRALDYLNKYM